ncbi:MAG: hypothetical protein ACNA8S_00780 [Deferrisomatales bacterium]
MGERGVRQGEGRRREVDAGERLPAGLVTPEELRLLLSPAPGAEGCPVLLLGPGPDRLESVASLLRGRGLVVTPAVNCYAALDALRRRPGGGVVAFAGSLPPDVGWYLDRLRAIDPGVRVCLIRDGSREPLPAGVPAVGPDLPGEEVDRLVNALGPGAPGEAGTTETGAVPERTQGPDPFLALRFLLEARLAGRPVEEGLLRWAAEDPAVRGWVDQEDRGGELRLRARAAAGEDRAGMLAAVLDRLGALGGRVREATAEGPFALFPRGAGDEGAVALWFREAAGAEYLARGLHLLGPLLAAVPDGRPGGDRDRLLSLLGSRMAAAERRGTRLGLVVFEGGPEGSPVRLSRMVRGLLRGSDWVEPLGTRVYVILEEPERGVFPILAARLQELPGSGRLRVAALGWTPLDGSASRLLERAEETLRSGGRGEWVPSCEGSPSPGPDAPTGQNPPPHRGAGSGSPAEQPRTASSEPKSPAQTGGSRRTGDGWDTPSNGRGLRGET